MQSCEFLTCKSGIFSKKPFGNSWIWFPLRLSFHKFRLFLNVSELKFEIMLSAAFSLFMQYLKTLKVSRPNYASDNIRSQNVFSYL